MKPISIPSFALLTLLLATLVPAAQSASPAASILDTVKSTGTLQCGVIREEEDYSKADTHGNRAAFDIDICKAISSAVIGDKGKVVFSAFSDEPSAIQALRAGKVQVIATATPSVTNKILLGVSFSPVILIDGQGFLVKKTSGITSPADLAGKKVCFIDQTTNVENLTAWSQREKVKVIPFPFEEEGEMEAAMYTANCAAMTSDVTQLANTRARFNVRAKEFDILPQLISKDPLAAAYVPGDAQWSAVVDATMSVILQAEESNLTAASIDQQRTDTNDPAIPLYFGARSGLATKLHLDPDWAVRVIHATGNYREMYERDLGSNNPLQLSRGANRLWNQGGLLYAPALGSR